MGKFGHLKQFDVESDHTTEYTISRITVNGVSPTLKVAPATEANKPYFNAQIRYTQKNLRSMRSGGMSGRTLEEMRELDRDLYPKYVIKGWRDVVDADGNDVQFSKSECEAFLSELPDWIFDEVREFCSNPQNHVDAVDVEATAKNSQTGSSGS